MTDGRHPCADGLTPACFKAYPDWAKMRFALKLMSTLFPAEITKRLPVEIQEAMAQMPPDWPAGETLPEALSIAPPAGLMPPAGGAIAPLYAAPFSPGPPQVPGGNKAPAETEPWFYDKFTTLDLTVWFENNVGAGTNTIDTSRLKQTAPAGSVAGLIKDVDATIPTAFSWTFQLTYDTDAGGSLSLSVFTQAHALGLEFVPPTTVSIYTDTGPENHTVDSFLGTTDTWNLTYTGSLCSLTRNGETVFTGVTPWPDATAPGYIWLNCSQATVFLDELKITEI